MNKKKYQAFNSEVCECLKSYAFEKAKPTTPKKIVKNVESLAKTSGLFCEYKTNCEIKDLSIFVEFLFKTKKNEDFRCTDYQLTSFRGNK